MRPRSLTALLACLLVLLGPPAAAAPAQAFQQAMTLSPVQPTPTTDPARLDAPPTARRLGLPSALAAVLAGGVVSLLVRLLLAEPAARRRTPGPPVTSGG